MKRIGPLSGGGVSPISTAGKPASGGSLSARDGGKTANSGGSVNNIANASGKTGWAPPVRFRPIPGMAIVEFPELVQLATTIGESLKLKKLPKALGYMRAQGGGHIVLDSRAYSSPRFFAMTLAHEIGHP